MLKTKEEIIKWLNDYEVKNYTINEDLTVDVSRSVNLVDRELIEIPIKFKKVNGNFNCSLNSVILAALKNAPDQTVIYYLSKELQEELGTKEPIQFFESKIKKKKIKP